MTRAPGWESRLDSVIEEARHRPCIVGESDCFRLACEAYAAVTGERNIWPDWAGKYSNHEDRASLMTAHGGFIKSMNAAFNSTPSNIRLARRGDVCAYKDRDSVKHLGVCVGDRVAMFGDVGMVFVPLLSCLLCWRVG
jgi:hypothetical protein